MKNYLLILTLLFCAGTSANAQAFRQLNIESNTNRNNRELEEARHKQRLEEIRQGQNGTSNGNVSKTIVNPNANVLQKNSYSDGMILAYIENTANSYTSNCRGEKKADKLVIENISGQTITVKYCFRHLLLNCEDNLEQEKTTYREELLKPGEKHSESGYLSNGKVSYYYIDSFSVMYVKMYEEGPNYTTQQIQQSQQQSHYAEMHEKRPNYIAPQIQQTQLQAHIDVEEIFRSMPETVAMQQRLAQEQEWMISELTAIENRYKNLMDEYQNNSGNLPESVLQLKQQELQDLANSYESYKQSSQNKIQQMQADLIKPIQDKINNAIKAVGDENNFGCIFDASKILFQKGIDAAPLVKRKLGI